MAYLVLESSVRTHRKFLAAGPAASWLWVCGLGYCQEGLTDGFIPRTALDFLGVKGAAKLADRLVLAALWDVVDGGWEVHDYLEHNRSADAVRDLMRRRAEGGKKGGRPKTLEVTQVETLKVIEVPDQPETLPETLSGSSGSSVRPSVLPTVRHAREEHGRPLMAGIDYHRRNCPGWGLAACDWGLCIPKYLWPQWEKRRGPNVTKEWQDELRQLVADAIAEGNTAGDTPEKFWPAKFEQRYGTSVQKAGKGARTVSAFDTAAAQIARRS